MIERPKLVLILTVLAVIGLSSLYAYASTIGPRAVEIGELDETYLGKLVEVQGMVVDVAVLPSGSIIIDLADIGNPASIVIFLGEDAAEEAPPLADGDMLKARGIVQVYANELEIVPEQGDDIIVLDREGPLEPRPNALSGSPWLFEGENVSVWGKVEFVWHADENWTLLYLGEECYFMMIPGNEGFSLDDAGDFTGRVEYSNMHGWWYLAKQ